MLTFQAFAMAAIAKRQAEDAKEKGNFFFR